MRNLKFAFSIGAMLTIVGNSPAPNDNSTSQPLSRYEFKGATLGMTIAEWKALPRSSNTNGATPSCAGDDDAAGKKVYRSQSNKDLGITLCRYMWNAPGYYEPAFIPIGDRGTSDSFFLFYKDRLYFISVPVGRVVYQLGLDGIIAKYGKPTIVAEDAIQNGLGNSFPRVISTWKRGSDTITALSISGSIRDASFTYVDTIVSDEVEKVRIQKRPPQDNM